MLISKTLLLMASSLALTTPVLAQEQAAAFEYSPVVRLMRSGQFQAEVWRRDVRTDQSDLAWSNREIYPTAAAAIIEACTSLRKNFDVTFSCSRAAPQGPATDRAPANPSAAAVAMKSAVPAVEHNVTLVKKPVGPERVTSGARAAWLKDFWKIQERQSGGGSGGGGGGSGGGGGGGGGDR